MGTDCAQDRVHAIVVNGHMTMTSTSVALLNIVANDWLLTEDANQCQVLGNGMLLQVIRCSLGPQKENNYMKTPTTRNDVHGDI